MRDRLGKYQILQQLGKGSMGEVYLAQDTVLGRQVAVKTIQAGSAFGDEARHRFEREARVTGVLNHPHIVTVYDFGEDEGVLFLAMEYVEGETLEAIIRKQSLSRAEILEILAQTCEALGFAHEHGIIHRDVKPGNVLVMVRGRRIQAKLMDFGVAMVDRSSLTQQGVWMGTVSYMAPEYLDTGKATPSSDLFAVGVMLYEVLTGGRKPFSGETTTTILNAILRATPAPLSPEEQAAAGPLLPVLLKALAKGPEGRYASAEALAKAIRDAAAGDPAPVATPASRSGKEPGTKPLVVGRGAQANVLSLRVALRQVEPGGTITILPGIYREALVLDRPVTLLGSGDARDIILESPKGGRQRVLSSGVVLRGLTVSGEGEGEDPALIEVEQGDLLVAGCCLAGGERTVLQVAGTASRATLEGCDLSGTGSLGVAVGDGASLHVAGGRCTGFQRAAVVGWGTGSLKIQGTRFESGLGVGIWLRDTAQADLAEAVVVDREAGGVELEGEARLVMKGGLLSGSRFAGLLVMERAKASLDGVEVTAQGASGIHLTGQAHAQGTRCRIHGNEGYGLSLQGACGLHLDDSEVLDNAHPGLLIGTGASAQLNRCRLADGRSLGMVCLQGGRGVLESCEISGNARTGAKVEQGASLLLLRCVLRDGQDTGLLVFQDAEATLEECVVHRNARGGILLAKDASDPVIRDATRIEDDLFRMGAQGELVKVAPVKKR